MLFDASETLAGVSGELSRCVEAQQWWCSWRRTVRKESQVTRRINESDGPADERVGGGQADRDDRGGRCR